MHSFSQSIVFETIAHQQIVIAYFPSPDDDGMYIPYLMQGWPGVSAACN